MGRKRAYFGDGEMFRKLAPIEPRFLSKG